jgi:hypothetical protein
MDLTDTSLASRWRRRARQGSLARSPGASLSPAMAAAGSSIDSPMSDSPRAQEYRTRATELRKQAAETKWAEIRDRLLELASRYDAMAEAAERQWNR